MADWDLEYLSEKVSQATSSLLLTEDPRNIASAFHTLSLAEDAQIEDDDARRWWSTVRAFLEVTDADHQNGGTDGAWYARAKRLTTDEKLELGRALWELHEWLELEYYRHNGVD